MTRLHLNDLPPALRAQIMAKIKPASDGPVAAPHQGRGGRGRTSGLLVPAPPAPVGARPLAAFDADELLAMHEAPWQQVITGTDGVDGWCNTHGWNWEHTRKTKGNRKGEDIAWQTATHNKGIPDLFPMWHSRWPNRHLAMEVKRDSNNTGPLRNGLEADQIDRLAELHSAGFETYGPVKPRHAAELDWILTEHPDDWPDGWVPTCAFPPGGVR
jgi:hypothetical protein